MINLIPPAAKKKVAQEYWVRVIIVWLFLLSLGFLIVSVFLLPTFVIINQKITSLQTQANSTSEKTNTFNVSAVELTSATAKARLLLKNSSSTPFSEYVTKLEKIAGSEVTINQFEFARTAAKGMIKLSGVAITRQSLADFRDNLDKEDNFSEINLPISNLIKEKNLLFSIEISLATSTVAI